MIILVQIFKGIKLTRTIYALNQYAKIQLLKNPPSKLFKFVPSFHVVPTR